jgi:uncharacterized iron-regulated protein
MPINGFLETGAPGMFLRIALLTVLWMALGGATPRPTSPPPFIAPLNREAPLVGRVVDGRTGVDLSTDDALARARNAQVVFLGERHDNPDHHALQAHVLGRLIDAGRRPALVFEMIDQDQEDALEAWRRTGADLATLERTLHWDERGWPSFSWYAPLFEAAVAHDLPILPGNPPRVLVRDIARGKAPDAVAALGLDRPLPKAAEKGLLDALRDGHCGMVPETALPAIALAQRAKDATMALAVTRALAEGADGVVVITGSEHARLDRGIPLALEAAPGILSIAFTEAPSGPTPPPKELGAHDLLWFTPGVDRGDPCVGLEDRFRPSKP